MSALSGLTGSSLNFTGLATGIDTDKIVSGLTALNERRISQLRARQAQEAQKQATYGGLQAKLSEFQGAVNNLARSIGGAVDTRKVSTTDDKLVTGVASSSALTGTYSVRVNQLAQAQQLASTGLADPSTNIKTGTLSIQVGTAQAFTVTVDNTNNTLQGLASTINAAEKEVRASVINDGGAYRLLLTGTKTGAANAISLTNNLSGGTGATLNLSERVVQDAKDAQVSLGNGLGAVTATSSTNRVENLITGVTLNLTGADASKTVTLTVSPDGEAVTKAIQGLVDSFNGALDFIDSRDDYDSATQKAGLFLGNRDITDLKNDLTAALTGVVPGVNSKVNRLGAIGISFDQKGKMQFDSSKLSAVLNGEVSGASAADLRRLFALTGTSTNSSVNFVLGGNKTRPTPVGQPYQVNVTQAATQARITGGTALASTVTITAGNNTFTIKVNNLAAAVITVTPGDYTPAQLTAAIQSQINGGFGSNQVAVDLDAGAIRFNSLGYGSGATLAMQGGSAPFLAQLGLAGAEASTGRNITGFFTVNGATEAATGTGQILSGNADNPNTSGLQVRAALTDAQLNATGPEADLTVTQGVAARVAQTLSKYMDPINGRFKVATDRFQKSIADVDKQVARQNATLEAKKESLLRQFAAMESAVSSLKNVGGQISAAFGIIPAR